MDKGPWEVIDDSAAISSDDFEHDVILVIYGDFADHAERRKYATWLSESLNKLCRESSARD